MLASRPVGPGAAARKYDILSALGAHALGLEPGEQRVALRLITLLTARYNWSADVLTVGQREIARLWSVDERTVKREMARLRERGWLRVLRQGARGRVTEYRLDLDLLLHATRPAWEKIGPDFTARMIGGTAAAAATNVLPFAPKPTELSEGSGVWPRAARLLQQEDPALFQAWLKDLSPEAQEGAEIQLKAPSKFHANYVSAHYVPLLLSALRRTEPWVQGVRIEA